LNFEFSLFDCVHCARHSTTALTTCEACKIGLATRDDSDDPFPVSGLAFHTLETHSSLGILCARFPARCCMLNNATRVHADRLQLHLDGCCQGSALGESIPLTIRQNRGPTGLRDVSLMHAVSPMLYGVTVGSSPHTLVNKIQVRESSCPVCQRRRFLFPLSGVARKMRAL
jgi:hypothetical protein